MDLQQNRMHAAVFVFLFVYHQLFAYLFVFSVQ